MSDGGDVLLDRLSRDATEGFSRGAVAVVDEVGGNHSVSGHTQQTSGKWCTGDYKEVST